MAFGTGHHETTCLMAEFLLEQSVKGKKVLDMGCGTGILGILADKMGALFTLAMDIDEICFQSSLENGILNEVDSMRVMKGDLPILLESIDSSLRNFDIILANINRNVLLKHLSGYSSLLKNGGNLFLSGFLEGHDLELLIEEARKSDLKYLFSKAQKGWCAAQFYK
jgi:ribosomal protein L11 methyltransferase